MKNLAVVIFLTIALFSCTHIKSAELPDEYQNMSDAINWLSRQNAEACQQPIDLMILKLDTSNRITFTGIVRSHKVRHIFRESFDLDSLPDTFNFDCGAYSNGVDNKASPKNFNHLSYMIDKAFIVWNSSSCSNKVKKYYSDTKADFPESKVIPYTLGLYIEDGAMLLTLNVSRVLHYYGVSCEE